MCYSLLKLTEKQGITDKVNIMSLPIIMSLLHLFCCKCGCTVQSNVLRKRFDFIKIGAPGLQLGPLGKAFLDPGDAVSAQAASIIQYLHGNVEKSCN